MNTCILTRFASLLILMLSAGYVAAGSFNLPGHDFSQWYNKSKPQYQGWRYIVLHHSATNAGSVAGFHKFHTEQGYGGIAYHFVIGNGNGMKDGEVVETFRWKEQISGTHASVNSWGHNVYGIGIALVGNFEEREPTPKQLSVLTDLIRRLSKQYNIPKENIIGHREVHFDDDSEKFERTLCPGKKLDIASMLERL